MVSSYNPSKASPNELMTTTKLAIIVSPFSLADMTSDEVASQRSSQENDMDHCLDQRVFAAPCTINQHLGGTEPSQPLDHIIRDNEPCSSSAQLLGEAKEVLEKRGRAHFSGILHPPTLSLHRQLAKRNTRHSELIEIIDSVLNLLDDGKAEDTPGDDFLSWLEI